MAQGMFNTLKKFYPTVSHEYEAISWGTGIGDKVNPKVIGPMKEIGINITDTSIYFPKDINHPYIKERLSDVVRVYTMGCMDNVCELPSGMQVKTKDVVDWDLEDPAEDETDVDAVRDTIRNNCLELIIELSKD